MADTRVQGGFLLTSLRCFLSLGIWWHDWHEPRGCALLLWYACSEYGCTSIITCAKFLEKGAWPPQVSWWCVLRVRAYRFVN